MAFRRSISCANLFDMCIKTCVSFLRKDETSLSEREAMVEAVYDGTRKSFENAIINAVRDPRLAEFTSCHLQQFKCHSHLFPLLCSDERSSTAENIIIAYGNLSLIKLINERADCSGLMVYMDLECMQNIIQSLEFNPICTKKSYLPLSDSDTLTPLADYNSPPISREDICSANSCCDESPSISLSNGSIVQDTGKLIPSQQSVVTYVLDRPFITAPIEALITRSESASGQSVSVENKLPKVSLFTRMVIIVLVVFIAIAVMFKLK